jgi:hypothetical protein
MQSTMGPRSGGRDLRVPYLTIVSGLALAVAAIVGFGGLPDLTPSAPGAQSAVQPAEAVTAAPARLLVYLVATEDRKRALEQEVATDREWFNETLAGRETAVRIVVLDRGQEESLESLAGLIPEASFATGLGPEIKLVDMR